jgi:hemoglobin-like flavoprotein
MSPHHVAIVHLSSENLRPVHGPMAELFCRRSFELDPTLRPLFMGNLKRQGRRLTQVLGLALSEPSRLDQLAPIVRDLGRRQARHGIEDSHYATFGSALLWTLERMLRADFTFEVRAAWTEAYQAVSTLMMEGAADTRERRAA